MHSRQAAGNRAAVVTRVAGQFECADDVWALSYCQGAKRISRRNIKVDVFENVPAQCGVDIKFFASTILFIFATDRMTCRKPC